MATKYLAYVLDEDSRSELLKRLPASFSNVKAHHITIDSDLTDECESHINAIMKYYEGCHAIVMSHYQGDGIHAAGIYFGGAHRRYDGSFYHVTLSHDENREPVDSNKLTYSKPIRLFALKGQLQILERTS